MSHSSTVAIYDLFFGEGQVTMDFFLSPKHHNFTVTKNAKKKLSGGRTQIIIFLGPIHHIIIATRNENIFSSLKVESGSHAL